MSYRSDAAIHGINSCPTDRPVILPTDHERGALVEALSILRAGPSGPDVHCPSRHFLLALTRRGSPTSSTQPLLSG
jgi:hypothetical protein